MWGCGILRAAGAGFVGLQKWLAGSEMRAERGFWNVVKYLHDFIDLWRLHYHRRRKIHNYNKMLRHQKKVEKVSSEEVNKLADGGLKFGAENADGVEETVSPKD